MYEYGNARLRAMKSRLLGRGDLESLAARGEVSQIIHALGRTAYGPDVATVLARASGLEAVEEALRLNLARTTRSVLSYYDGRARDLVRLLLLRYDLFNLLGIVRGKAAQASPEEIEQALLPGGALPDAVLRELAAQEDLRRTVDLMVTWRLPWGWPLARAMRAYVQSKDLSVLELALARHHYSSTLEELQGNDHNVQLVRRLFGLEVDTLNLATALRVCLASPRPAEDGVPGMFLEGGERLEPRFVAGLCAASGVEQILARLGDLPYARVLGAEIGRFVSSGRVSVLQQALERFVTRWAISLFRDDPLSVGTVIAYLAAKTNEVTNLRTIARGIALGLERDDLLSQVWTPG